MWRNAGPILLLLLVLGLFGGFAWLTQNPETPWLEEAEDWPVVGDLAHRFRVAYLGRRAASRDARTTAAPAAPGEDRGPGPGRPAAPRPVNRPPPLPAPAVAEAGGAEPGRGSAREPLVRRVPRLPTLPVGAGPSMTPTRPGGAASRSYLDHVTFTIDAWTWVLPGNRILAGPEPDAAVREELRAMAYLPVLGRDGDWAQVLYRKQPGWVDTSWQPPHQRRKAGRGILRHRFEPVRASDTRLLKKARRILGIERPSVKLGPYELYTDVDDEELLGFLDLAAGTAEEAYFARYGRLPSGDPRRSAVLFAREADYRTYSESARGLPGTQVGHAGSGVLAFFAEGRSRQSLGRTLVHEIGHLLNRRALALGLPPWLEEGLASDLGSLWVEGSPEAAPHPLERFGFALSGPEMGFLRLDATLDAGQLPSVAVLMGLGREKFLLSSAYAYTHSVAFVRYLLDSADAGHGEAFRTFLKRIAIGHGADPDTLLELLGMEIEELDRSFRAWLDAEALRSRERIAGRVPAAGGS